MPMDEARRARAFRGALGAEEHFLSLHAPPGEDFASQLRALEAEYAALRARLDLLPESAIFRRVYLSDAQNQAAAVAASTLGGTAAEGAVGVSFIEQPPLPGAKLALLAYHVAGGGDTSKQRLGRHHILAERNGSRHLWSGGLCCGATAAAQPAAAQTRAVFGDLVAALAGVGANLRDHCVRTWIFLKDVDVFYEEMVAARRSLFAAEGLTAETHYIASTGIEGACADRYDLIAMDAYSLPDLAPGQRRHLNDFSRLCATQHYNVTFERATRIGWADRAHIFLSGTASIDATGSILHPGDVLAQLDRALANAEALLRSGGGGLGDLAYLLVYLRDASDFARVDAVLRARFAELPILILAAPVCRPGWLVEIEGVAIVAAAEPGLPRF
ncbi:MAG: Rid family hydrolase [Acetobacteraceae bacterium]